MPRRKIEIDPEKNYSQEEFKRLKRNEYQRRWYAKLSDERKNALRHIKREYTREWKNKGNAVHQTVHQTREKTDQCGQKQGQKCTKRNHESSIAINENIGTSSANELRDNSIEISNEDNLGSSSDAGRRKRVRLTSYQDEDYGGCTSTENYSPSTFGTEDLDEPCDDRTLRRLRRNELKRRWYNELPEQRKDILREERREYIRENRSSRSIGEGSRLFTEVQPAETTEVVASHAWQSNDSSTNGIDVGNEQLHMIARDHWQQQITKMRSHMVANNGGFVWNKACPYCHTMLLRSENDSFCCNNGKRILPTLPNLPPTLVRLFAQKGLSKNSRKLNRLFCFTALCVQGEFVHLDVPSSVAMMGRTYHQLLPITKAHQPIHWYIHDQEDRYATARSQSLPVEWVMQVGAVLNAINPYCGLIRKVAEMRAETAMLSLNGAIVSDEVGAIIHGNNTVTLNPRSAVFWIHNEQRDVYISILDPQYEPLQYPLLFPHGTLGWSPGNGLGFSQIDWYRCRLLHESRFFQLGRLTCEYLVDMYSRYEEEKLNYLATNGYNRDDPDMNADFAENESEEHSRILLPSSFLGSRLWCSVQMADALALARAKGRPTLFVTMTTNPQWSEIESMLQPGQTPAEIPTIVVRAFHARLQYLKNLLRSYFGPIAYMLHVIEFQKRGLPHAHMILKTKYEIPIDMIDSLISAEIPADEALAQLVRKFMVHEHSTRCLKNGRCCWNYPHPITEATYVDSSGYVKYRRRTVADVNVVSYSPFLLSQLECHINVDIAATVQVFMYLYTYIYKGYDKVQFRIDNRDRSQNEIDDYITARYVSSTEAAWRIFLYHVSEKHPAVKCLPVHLEQRTGVRYRRANSASYLDRYFLRPDAPEFSAITYVDYYEQYSLTPLRQAVGSADGYLELSRAGITQYVVRKRSKREAVCRIRLVMPHEGEIFYLRQLLLRTSPRSWGDLKTYNGQTYETYQETATAMGLLQDATEPILTMEEAISSFQTPSQLRFLFTLLILDGAAAVDLWNKFRSQLTLDFSAESSAMVAEQQALICIENVLLQHGTNVAEFGLPSITIRSDLVLQELRKFPEHTSYLEVANAMRSRMNTEQAEIYEHIAMITQQLGPKAPTFIYGKAGTGKTFLLNAICFLIRSRQRIVLPCATTALAALLYPGGRTAHSLFQIPVTENNIAVHSMINTTSDKAILLRESEVIIWDEFAMANKAVIESVNILLQRICKNNLPFGGKCFIASGDFRQIAPIVHGSGRQATIDASVKSSHIWNAFSVWRLNNPVRNANDPELVECVTSIGENWQSDSVNLTLFRTTNSVDEAKDFLFTRDVLLRPAMCEKRAFLSPLNVHVDDFNKSILDRLATASKAYFSYDSITENDQVIHTVALAENDFLHNYDHPTLPKHVLELKEGAICQVMRLLDKEKGLVKNARVIIHMLHDRYVTVRLLGTDDSIPDYIHPICRADFYHQPQNSAFTIHRRQLPLRLAYSTTFHSCLGLTLDKIVLDLRTNVFAHGQLYTALTRIRHREDALILHNSNSSTVTTKNVVFRELLE